MTKGIIYVRVSSTDQTQGTSLDNQERACLEYAGRNNIEVVRTFIEKGESATAATRTEFLKALDFCRDHAGEVNAFIVWKIDRFARNTTDHFAVRSRLTKYGVTLQSVTEPITQDHMGKLMETFLAGYAEFENEVRKQRCTGGMQARLSEGIRCWGPPIGYVNSKKIKDRRKTTPDVPDKERFYLIQNDLLQLHAPDVACNRGGVRIGVDVDGIDGRLVSMDELIQDCLIEPGTTNFTSCTLGNALSHRALWLKSVALGKILVVCEDDAVLRQDFRRQIDICMKALPFDWEFLLLGFNFNSILDVEVVPGVEYLVGRFGRRRLGDEELNRCQQMSTSSTVLRLRQAFGTPGYVISPWGARNLLSRVFPLHNRLVRVEGLQKTIVSFSIDSILNGVYQDIGAFVCFPPLLVTPNTSDLSALRH